MEVDNILIIIYVNLKKFLDLWDPGGSSDQHDLVDIRLVHLVRDIIF